jgi:hypothetical protein
MFNLALAYWSGSGIASDSAQYYEWTRKAAATGNTRAMFNLALAYEDGQGGDADSGKYLHWLQQAAEGGEPAAMYNVALCFDEGVATEVDPRRSFSWMRRAAEAGYVDAMFLAALALQAGRGTERDTEEFDFWIAKAAEAGHREALVTRGLADLESRQLLSDSRRAALAVSFRELVKVVRAVRNSHIVDSAPQGVCHYTTWEALESMLPADGSNTALRTQVRLYNVALSDEIWEGRRLVELEDPNALLLAAFVVEPTEERRGPRHDTYLASFSLDTTGVPPASTFPADCRVYRIITPFGAFDQRRSRSKPHARIRSPLLPGERTGTGSAPDRATLLRVKYSDEEAGDALAALAKPLATITSACEELDDDARRVTAALVRTVVGEIQHLYHYEERSHEQEARLVTSLPIASSRLCLDESTPGRLYAESAGIFFTSNGSEIVVPGTDSEATAALLNLEHRLSRHGLRSVIVRRGS